MASSKYTRIKSIIRKKYAEPFVKRIGDKLYLESIIKDPDNETFIVELKCFDRDTLVKLNKELKSNKTFKPIPGRIPYIQLRLNEEFALKEVIALVKKSVTPTVDWRPIDNIAEDYYAI